MIQSKLWEKFLDTKRKSCSCHTPIFPLACPTLWANPAFCWSFWHYALCPPLHGVANQSFPTPQLSKLRTFLTYFPWYCFCTLCCASCTTITYLHQSFPLQYMHGDPYLYNLPSPYSAIFLLYGLFSPKFSRLHTHRRDTIINKPHISYQEQITVRERSIEASVPLIYHPTPSFLLLTPTTKVIPSQQSLQRKTLTFVFPNKTCSKLWCNITRFCSNRLSYPYRHNTRIQTTMKGFATVDCYLIVGACTLKTEPKLRPFA